MSLAMWGILLGLSAGLGVALVLSRLTAIRRTPLETRVLPYVRDLPQVGRAVPMRAATSKQSASPFTSVFGPLMQRAAESVERVLGGATSVRRRLERAGIDKTVHEFRIEQVQWGLVGFAGAAVLVGLRVLRDPGSALPGLLVCLVAFASGVLLRENQLTSQVKDRERRILAEFPTIAVLLALSVAAGESPVAALDRVVRRSHGELSSDLARVLAEVRTGEPVGSAFDKLAARTGLPLVARFAEGVAVAVERGTPLADVLHAQAADVREAGRRELIEAGARKEVAMMVPVVFLILPVTIMFAFWPGFVGLTLTTP